MSHKKEKGNIHVLLVCCDQTCLETEKRCLECQGDLHVETASSTDEVLIKIERAKPDVIVEDWSCMHDGFELVRSLRSRGDTTPIILFAYSDEKEAVSQAYDLGTIGFVEKSGNPSTVFSNLKSCIVAITKRKLQVEQSDHGHFLY
jgi:DNA-binding NarL/FixJ family response regulator